MDRVIFHVDVNSAFLSWEAVYRLYHLGGTVDLREIPSAVGANCSRPSAYTGRSHTVGTVTIASTQNAIQKTHDRASVFTVLRNVEQNIISLLLPEKRTLLS